MTRLVPVRAWRKLRGCVLSLSFVRTFAAAAAVVLAAGVATQAEVRVWEEPMVIPTYPLGPADPNPIFYHRESYQGAQKRVYPYALQDRLTHTREDRTYTAVHLENEYVRLTVLPEIGGRLFAATDKTNGYDFFYRQHVIKPALIGMLGAWISGGVEWCAFHHHRNTTFMPVDYRLAENSDGSRTIWFGEIERRHRMKWLVGLTLHPGRSYIETTVKLINRTPQPHSILYWANVAVHSNNDYQVVFPPSVQVATHHSKIAFTHWPVSQGKYLGTDYTGLDISWCKNSASAASFFAWDLREDFMGGYDHGRQAGVVHVGDHHRVCGAKLWEWGTGPSGQIWEKILTDEDGPYVELMVGAWSDNQPDYSWIKPYETKVIRQYWYPVRELGTFKNANLNGAVNLEVKDGTAHLAFNTTRRYANARVVLTAGGQAALTETIDIAPDRPFRREVAIPADCLTTDLRALLFSSSGEELISYQPVQIEPPAELPAPAEAPPIPAKIQNQEELYLTGLRIEQIHNPAVDPLDYYREAVERDPGDSRCNTALGINANKRGKYAEAERYLRQAIKRLTEGYMRPGNTEAYYQLGLALRGQGRLTEAEEAFHRASWDSAFHSAAHHQLAELLCRRGDWAHGLEHVEASLSTNALNTRARCIRAMILRRLGRPAEARAEALAVLAVDPLDFLAGHESVFAERATQAPAVADGARAELQRAMRGEVQSYLEVAADYAGCGLWSEAIEVLHRLVETDVPFGSTYPLVHYWLGYLHEQNKHPDEALKCYRRAARMPADYCFPFRLESIDVLNSAMRARGRDARAPYYLGNLLFDLQPEAAVACWEKAKSLDDGFSPAHRNLGWAAYRAKDDVAGAIAHYERAVACNGDDPRLYLELDVLYEAGNVDPQRRLTVLERRPEVVRSYQDSLLRQIMVLVLAERFDAAVELLTQNHFHAREGAERIGEVYSDAFLLRGLERLKARRFREALDDFGRAGVYPDSLALGRRTDGRRTAQVAYCTGSAWEALGEADKAREFYEQAARASVARPEARYYRGVALMKLDRRDEAEQVFTELSQTTATQPVEREESDFFAKFGERQRESVRQAVACFTAGLGQLGSGEIQKARENFQRAVQLNAGHVWARYFLAVAEQAPAH